MANSLPENKDVTKLVRAMRKHLHNDHALDIPHSALRASYLKALGQNPHASSPRAQASQPVPKPSEPLPQRTLYLVGDEAGVNQLLALDPEGLLMLPADFQFGYGAVLMGLAAEIPSVKRYGLPDYLANPSAFFKRFGLSVSSEYRATYTDSGDDSGDTCQIEVALPLLKWDYLLSQVVQDSDASLSEEVEEWCGLHYGRNFDAMSLVDRLEMTLRYLEMQREAEALAEAPQLVFEWVYPDEDGGSCPVQVDLVTREVTLLGEVPSDIRNSCVRTRLMTEEWNDPVPVYFQRTDNSGVWKFREEDLPEVKALFS